MRSLRLQSIDAVSIRNVTAIDTSAELAVSPEDLDSGDGRMRRGQQAMLEKGDGFLAECLVTEDVGPSAPSIKVFVTGKTLQEKEAQVRAAVGDDANIMTAAAADVAVRWW
jgi:hypothetical protein